MIYIFLGLVVELLPKGLLNWRLLIDGCTDCLTFKLVNMQTVDEKIKYKPILIGVVLTIY